MNMVYRCSQCAGRCVVAGSDAARDDPSLPVMGWTTEDETGAPVSPEVPLCDRCAAVRIRWALTDGRPQICYVGSGAREITTWGGTPVARIVRSSTFRSDFGGRIMAWRGVLPNGLEIYGRGAGTNLATTARPCKGRSAV